VVIFNDRIGDAAGRSLRRGQKVYVDGVLQTRKRTDQSGQERYSTEVVIGPLNGELVFLDLGSSRSDAEQSDSAPVLEPAQSATPVREPRSMAASPVRPVRMQSAGLDGRGQGRPPGLPSHGRPNGPAAESYIKAGSSVTSSTIAVMPHPIRPGRGHSVIKRRAVRYGFAIGP
jgi:single-stranded DNA-binding protein